MTPIPSFFIMNINKALVVICTVLSLLVVITVINFNCSKSVSSTISENTDDEALTINIQCIPEIVRSYEKVKDIYDNRNMLFFRYADNSCNTCRDSQLIELLNFQEEIGKEYVWIFPAYTDDRNSQIRLSAELSKYNYRNIPADSLLIPVYEGDRKSYFSWINSDGEIEMVFIPDRGNIHHTRQYFLEIKRLIRNLEEN